MKGLILVNYLYSFLIFQIFNIHQLFCWIVCLSIYMCAFRHFCRFFVLHFCTWVMNMAYDQGKAKLLMYSYRCSWQAFGSYVWLSVCLGEVCTPHTSICPSYLCTPPIHLYALHVCMPPYVCTPPKHPYAPNMSIHPPYDCTLQNICMPPSP